MFYKEPPTEKAVTGAKHFLAAIKRKEEPSKAAAHLGKTTNLDIMRWRDENDLDLMHHVIILNVPEAAEYLLSHGYFQVCPRADLQAFLIEHAKYFQAISLFLSYADFDFPRVVFG